MAIEGTLQGPNGESLFIGADHQVIYTDADNPPKNMLGWTVFLDIRKKDTSSDPALLHMQGTVVGVYNADPLVNTQQITWDLTNVDLAATIFKGDDPTLRYSVKRTDHPETVLRFGDAPLIRVTQV